MTKVLQQIDKDLIKEVMNSDMNDDVKVEIIMRLAQKQEPIYIPYAQSPANWWESSPIYVSAPTTGDPVENQPHAVRSDFRTSTSVPNKTCPECNGRGMVQIGGCGNGVKGLEKCKVCDGKGYVEDNCLIKDVWTVS